MAKRILWFGTKAGLFGATVYYTNEIGIWNDSEQTTKLLEDITAYVKPYFKENAPQIKNAALPSMAEVCSASKTCWNKGVLNSMMFLTNLPDKVVCWSKCGIAFVSKQLEQVEGKKEEN